MRLRCLFLLLGLFLLFSFSLPACRAPAPLIEEAEALTTRPMDPASTQPAKVDPDAARAYLNRILQDETRLIEAFINENELGVMDDFGRNKLLQAVPGWFGNVTQEPTSKRFKITPEMGIMIYAPGTADGKKPPGPPAVLIHVYKHRRIARVMISDPERERLSSVVFILNTPDPVAWIDRLFAGTLPR